MGLSIRENCFLHKEVTDFLSKGAKNKGQSSPRNVLPARSGFHLCARMGTNEMQFLIGADLNSVGGYCTGNVCFFPKIVLCSTTVQWLFKVLMMFETLMCVGWLRVFGCGHVRVQSFGTPRLFLSRDGDDNDFSSC